MSKRKSASYTKKKDSKFAKNGKEKVSFQGYVNWELTDSYREVYEKWLTSNPDIESLVERLLQDGYSLKHGWDEYNECYTAGLYCIDRTSTNCGWFMSMRSMSYVRSLERVIFVHYIAFKGIWVTEAEQAYSDDQW